MQCEQWLSPSAALNVMQCEQWLPPSAPSTSCSVSSGCHPLLPQRHAVWAVVATLCSLNVMQCGQWLSPSAALNIMQCEQWLPPSAPSTSCSVSSGCHPLLPQRHAVWQWLPPSAALKPRIANLAIQKLLFSTNGKLGREVDTKREDEGRNAGAG